MAKKTPRFDSPSVHWRITKAKIGELDTANIFLDVCRATIDALPANKDPKGWIDRAKRAESLIKERSGE